MIRKKVAQRTADHVVSRISESGLTARGLEKVMSIQRPLVQAHLRGIVRRHPDADAARLTAILERHYLAAVTTGGAAIGASAVIPGVGTGISLALSGAEIVGFLEATALYAQTLAELHGIPVTDPARARALVLTLMLGQEGVSLVTNLAAQSLGAGPNGHWAQLITNTLPKTMLGPLIDQLKGMFIRHLAAKAGASLFGKALPFGVGAAVGGIGNLLMGRQVVAAARQAFAHVPIVLPHQVPVAPGQLQAVE